MMTNTEFVAKLKLAASVETLYVMGGFGAPAGYGRNRTRYCTNNKYNKNATRTKMIKECSDNTFFFDCVCLGKGILWGWDAKTDRVYGGAKYTSNGVPDFGAGSAMKHCTDVSSDFSKLTVGEWLYMPGHVGYYVGDGYVIESSPKWKNKVQYTKLTDRKWETHGKLKYIKYEEPKPETNDPGAVTCPKCGHSFTPASKTVDELAREVLDGKWGNGADRKNRLTAAGYNYADVQKRVNELCK